MEKVFHPTMKSSTVEQTDPEALTLCATFLHEIGWFTQQNGFEGLRQWIDCNSGCCELNFLCRSLLHASHLSEL